MKKIKSICILFVVGAFFCFLPSIGQTMNIPCDCSTQKLQDAINDSSFGDTITVTGTCNENVTVYNSNHGSTLYDQDFITIDGQNAATIQAKDATQPAVKIWGTWVTIKNFADIREGTEGVLVLYGGSAAIDHNTISNNHYGVDIYENSYARITNNTINSNSLSGILVLSNSSATIGINSNTDTTLRPNTIQNNAEGITVERTSSAVIVGNTISYNTEVGIMVWQHSSALIGFSSVYDTTPKANAIQHNGNTQDNQGGVQVSQSSNALIVGNTVSNNTGPGIKVDRGSQADISDNWIGNNSTNGIGVAHNSGVNLGNKTGTTIFDLPNKTGTNNAMRGISCTIGGYVDGRLGTLNGSQGTTLFTNGCISAL